MGVTNINSEARALTHEWESDPRWAHIDREYAADDVVRLRGSVRIEQTVARRGAERLWEQLDVGFVRADVRRDDRRASRRDGSRRSRGDLSERMAGRGRREPGRADLSRPKPLSEQLRSSAGAPAEQRAASCRSGRMGRRASVEREWLVPIVADAEAGFGGPLHAFELMKAMIEAGAAGVHFEDQLAAEKKCGHMGGKVLVPTAQFERTLTAARLAADVLDVPTVIVARTDALGANLLTSDIDERDRPFATGERTVEGYYRVTGGMESAVSRVARVRALRRRVVV